MGHERSLRIAPGGPSWPVELDRIDAPPEALWLAGRTEVLAAEPRVAIVGTRAPTPYGLEQARRFARELASAGLSIVSGLARGIDQAAHTGALDAGGSTLAVLGSGVDRPWPAGEVAERLLEDGALLSEFPPGQGPRPHHFPLRNRLIAGLSLGVVVIEAARASGSLITARWAADQGRCVLALPGRVDHPMSAGTHRLLREGAALVESPRDVLEELGLTELAERTCEPAGRAAGRAASGTRGERGTPPLVLALRGETLGADELAERLGASIETVLVELVELEIKGAVVRGPGGLYRLPG